MVKNLFLEDVAVERYDTARPYFHPLVFERLSAFMPLSRKVDLSLDVACGTGHSAEALALVSEQVVGLDTSAAMLRQALRRRSCVWVQGAAEQLPFLAEKFDIVAVGLAFHWFDRLTFLREAHRVLRPKAWLLIYSDYFSGTMRENSSFIEWTKQYLAHFPTPSRHSQPLSAETFIEIGFHELGNEGFNHAETYDIDQLMAYLSTQTNVMAALIEGRETPGSVASWFRATLGPLFTKDKCTFDYAGSLSLYEKVR